MSTNSIALVLVYLIYIYVNFADSFKYDLFCLIFMFVLSTNLLNLLFLSILLYISLNTGKCVFNTIFVVLLCCLESLNDIEVIFHKKTEISKYIGIYEILVKDPNKGLFIVYNILFTLFWRVLINH